MKKELKVVIPEGYEIDKKNSSFEEIIFKKISKDITERIKTVEDACKELGECNKEVKTLRKLESVCGLPGRVVNNQKLIVVIKALNEGWYPDFSNNENKYYPWFDMRGGQVLGRVVIWDSSTCVPAPSLFKSEKLVKYATSQFLELYRSVFA